MRLDGFGGRLGSFRLGGTSFLCAQNPYGKVCSLESLSKVTVSGLRDSFEEIVGIFLVWIPDSSVEFRVFGELFRCGLGSIESCSTKNTSESTEPIEILQAILEFCEKRINIFLSQQRNERN